MKITRKVADEIDMLEGFTKSFYVEIKELSKKKPNDALNEFKVKKINKVLERVKKVISEDPSSVYLDILDIDELPTNSDSAIVLNQFNSAIKNFREKRSSYGEWIIG